MRYRKGPIALLIAVAVAGTTLSVFVWRRAVDADAADKGKQMEFRANWRATDMSWKLAAPANSVRAIAATFATLSDPEVRSFDRAMIDQFRTLGAVRVFLWLPRIAADERESFERGMRELGNRDFSIVEPDATGRIAAAPERVEYFPTVQTWSFDGLPPPIGLNISRTPISSAAMSAARDSGKVTMADPIIAVSTRQSTLLFYAPVYRGKTIPGTVAERRAALRGFVSGAVIATHIFDKAIENTPAIPENIYVATEAYTGADGDAAQIRPFVRHNPEVGRFEIADALIDPAALPGRAIVVPLRVADRQWTAVFHFPPHAIDALRAPGLWVWLAAGLSITGLVLFAINLELRQGIRAERLVEERTAEIQALRRRNELILTSAGEGIYGLDLEGRVSFINPAGARILGYAVDELFGQPMHAKCHHSRADGSPFPQQDCPIYAALRDGLAHMSRDDTMWRKDGSAVPIEYVSTPIRDDQGRLEGAVVIFADATERRAMEHALRRQAERDEALVRALGQIVYEWLPAENVVHWAGDVTPVLGYGVDELGHHTDGWLDRIHPDDQRAVASELEDCTRGRRKFELEYRFRHRDGRYLWMRDVGVPSVDADGQLGRMIGVFSDITEQRAARLQLAQAQKMDAIGQLTGGIAHDFNNLLGVVVGNLDLAAERLKDDANAHELVDAALNGALSGAELIKKLLAFSRKQALAPETADLNKRIKDLMGMLKRVLAENIAIKTLLAADLWPVLVDPVQFDTAMLNLAVNARDAMPGGGELTIQTANKRLDADYSGSHLDVAEGNYAMVAISDTGTGMPPETLARAFEPFFTTKETGKGTGLGLAMVHGFVKQSGGHAAIYSEVGHGTMIRLYFPVSQEAGAVVPKDAGAEPARATGGETVLVVEDRADLRAAAVAMLRRLGYRTLEAGTGPSALAVLESGEKVDLVFTDIVMPGGMSGLDLVHEIRTLGLKVPVLVTSGYASPHLLREQARKLGLPTLLKPYRVAELAEKIKAALARKTEESA